MDIWHLFSLFGGLALFLFGMNQMGSGLELAAGSKLQKILQKLTSNRFLGVLVGIVVTAIIQSSSATTVMVVGFVNAGLMNLAQAINIIMGANIGTTVTGLIIALNISKFAPLIAFIGLLFSFSHTTRNKEISKIIIGLGFLFMGLEMMGEAMKPLSNEPRVHDVIAGISSPILGILIGIVFTAIIQSSSASVGILQTLARQGLVPFSIAFYFVLGQNIGTCITSVLASINGNRSAKRAALSHVLFNLFGAVFFLIVSQSLPLARWIENMTDQPASQIALLHILFNIVTTIILFPFSKFLARFAEKLIPERMIAEDDDRRLIYVRPNNFADNIIMISNMKLEILRLYTLAEEAVNHVFAILDNYNEKDAEALRNTVSTLRFVESELMNLDETLLGRRLAHEHVVVLTNYIQCLSNLDRVADYALQILDLEETNMKDQIAYSDAAKDELKKLSKLLRELIQNLKQADLSTGSKHNEINLELADFRMQVASSRNAHILRMRESICDAASGLTYNTCLSFTERICHHLVESALALHSNTLELPHVEQINQEHIAVH